MSFNTNDCQHRDEIIDERNGDVICISCGLVMDSFYVNNSYHEEKYFDKYIKLHNSVYDYICEILERLNISRTFLSQISDLYTQKYKFYSTSNKYILVAFCCYQVLNENNISISIKNISAVTGHTVEEISQIQGDTTCIVFDTHNALEKYCKMLNLSFHDYSLIKETIPIDQSSGHNPLTIISSAIYLYCLKTKINLSLKEICDITGISKISVQRYIRTFK